MLLQLAKHVASNKSSSFLQDVASLLSRFNLLMHLISEQHNLIEIFEAPGCSLSWKWCTKPDNSMLLRVLQEAKY